MRVHIIINDVVQNTIVADLTVAQALHPDAVVIEATEGGPGWGWDGVTLTPPTPQEDKQAAAVRAERNARLIASDWTQLSDAPIDTGAWASYRQALRDVTDQSGFPWEVSWPAMPQ